MKVGRITQRKNIEGAKARRAAAMARNELRQATEPRTAAAGPTSLAIKVMDEDTRRLIDEALAKRRGA